MFGAALLASHRFELVRLIANLTFGPGVRKQDTKKR
jgi:hypothetical protein